jgi:hypothetical protein
MNVGDGSIDGLRYWLLNILGVGLSIVDEVCQVCKLCGYPPLARELPFSAIRLIFFDDNRAKRIVS